MKHDQCCLCKIVHWIVRQKLFAMEQTKLAFLFIISQPDLEYNFRWRRLNIHNPHPLDRENLTDRSLSHAAVSMVAAQAEWSDEFCRSQVESKGNAALGSIHLKADVQGTALHHYAII